MTEDDLSGRPGGVSIVGVENQRQAQASPAKAEGAEGAQNTGADWRGRGAANPSRNGGNRASG
jgi:hypothetical protein